jgi:hypothetical protein
MTIKFITADETLDLLDSDFTCIDLKECRDEDAPELWITPENLIPLFLARPDIQAHEQYKIIVISCFGSDEYSIQFAKQLLAAPDDVVSREIKDKLRVLEGGYRTFEQCVEQRRKRSREDPDFLARECKRLNLTSQDSAVHSHLQQSIIAAEQTFEYNRPLVDKVISQGKQISTLHAKPKSPAEKQPSSKIAGMSFVN